MWNSLLSLGRSVGLDNITQFQNLRRAFRSDKAVQCNAHFELNNSFIDEFLSSASTSVNDFVLPSIIRRFFPKTFSDKAKTLVDVIFKRTDSKISSGTSFLTAKGVTKYGNDSINNVELKVIKNQSGTVLDLEGSGESKIRSSLNMCVSDTESVRRNDVYLMNTVNYAQRDSQGKLTVKMPLQGRLKYLHSETAAPVELFDAYAALRTGDKNKTFKSVINETIELLKEKNAAQNLLSGII